MAALDSSLGRCQARKLQTGSRWSLDIVRSVPVSLAIGDREPGFLHNLTPWMAFNHGEGYSSACRQPHEDSLLSHSNEWTIAHSPKTWPPKIGNLVPIVLELSIQVFNSKFPVLRKNALQSPI